ncbi:MULTISPECIES: glycosyl hydrolase family 18 protein [Sphingobacterium]|uniref:glycosyl hydrolase family 18 protein n=1 Tax=Sphingobacterium TaxID=28453 RepID=UPI0013D978BA|nr:MULTISPECIES: glycosyl hydrolase family 18 protein [unclassified Sphingobacterium]
MKKILLSIFSFALFFSCEKEIIKVPDGYGVSELKKPEGDYVVDNSFKRVAYSWGNIDPVLFDTTKLDYLTHVHFAFLYPKEDGSLTALSNEVRFESLNELAISKGVKTAISLAGDENVYRTIASSAAVRKAFVKNVVEFAVRNNLSGIDLDWEYPRANYGSDVTFALLVKELSLELHSWHKYLSIAVTAGVFNGPVKDGITKEAIDAVDFVNLMAYDAIGRDAQQPSHHSTYAIANKVLDVWLLEKNVPKEKVVLGVPAYGLDVADNPRTYANLLAAGADPNADSFIIDKIEYYYNGIATIKAKTELAKSRGNGVMFWEYSQDTKGANSLIKAAYEVSK